MRGDIAARRARAVRLPQSVPGGLGRPQPRCAAEGGQGVTRPSLTLTLTLSPTPTPTPTPEPIQDSEAFFFSRSGFTTSPRVSPLFWLGDQLPTWDERDGMASALSGALSSDLQPQPQPQP